MLRILIAVLLALPVASAPDAVFDRTFHDFGKVTTKDGPLSCVFNVKNTGSDPMYIVSVLSSCGCTNVKWTKTAIAPGESGQVEATYSNDEEPGAFDKALTVYTTASPRPIVLHLRGSVKKNL